MRYPTLAFRQALAVQEVDIGTGCYMTIENSVVGRGLTLIQGIPYIVDKYWKHWSA